MNTPSPSNRPLAFLAASFAAGSLVLLLLHHHLAEGDLWAKLSLGAWVWHTGNVPSADPFAFTQVLPRYIDHEWGAGWVFFTCLTLLGPPGLMLLKVTLALGVFAVAFAQFHRSRTSPAVGLLLCLLAAPAFIPAFFPVLRSHTFTYLGFACLLHLLERIRHRHTRAATLLPPLFLLWANLHGGFVAGLCILGLYTIESALSRRQTLAPLAIGFAAAFALTFVNPYGLDFWRYLVPALLHQREIIVEWLPMRLWGFDHYLGFRLLFLGVLTLVLLSWKQPHRPPPLHLLVLALVTFLAWRSRRHAPFLGIAALLLLGPCLQAELARLTLSWPAHWRSARRAWQLLAAATAALAFLAVTRALPTASLGVLAPAGHYPVREIDILSLANAQGNLAAPFSWGSYAAWRLHPNIRISIDGRYEAAYPESTFLLNHEFFDHLGPNWDRLLEDYSVDFVILDLAYEKLRPDALRPHDFVPIWTLPGRSMLLARSRHAPTLLDAASRLPPTTIEPLDPNIPAQWFKGGRMNDE